MKYVASDGNIFDTVEECMAYERKIDSLADCFAIAYCCTMYDISLKRLDCTSADVTNCVSRCGYIHIHSNTEYVRQILRKYGGITEIDGPGIYVWVDYSEDPHNGNQWRKIETMIREHKMQMDSLEAIKTGILQAQANREAGIYMEG